MSRFDERNLELGMNTWTNTMATMNVSKRALSLDDAEKMEFLENNAKCWHTTGGEMESSYSGWEIPRGEYWEFNATENVISAEEAEDLPLEELRKLA